MKSSIRLILENTKTIVILGASRDKNKDSFKVMKYLKKNNYKIIPINPNIGNEKILGQKVYNDLKDVEEQIDILNIFRPPAEVFELAKKAINKKVKTIWLQLDISCLKTEKLLKNTEINLIQNKCTQIEHRRIFNTK